MAARLGNSGTLAEAALQLVSRLFLVPRLTKLASQLLKQPPRPVSSWPSHGRTDDAAVGEALLEIGQLCGRILRRPSGSLR